MGLAGSSSSNNGITSAGPERRFGVSTPEKSDVFIQALIWSLIFRGRKPDQVAGLLTDGKISVGGNELVVVPEKSIFLPDEVIEGEVVEIPIPEGAVWSPIRTSVIQNGQDSFLSGIEPIIMPSLDTEDLVQAQTSLDAFLETKRLALQPSEQKSLRRSGQLQAFPKVDQSKVSQITVTESEISSILNLRQEEFKLSSGNEAYQVSDGGLTVTLVPVYSSPKKEPEVNMRAIRLARTAGSILTLPLGLLLLGTEPILINIKENQSFPKDVSRAISIANSVFVASARAATMAENNYGVSFVMQHILDGKEVKLKDVSPRTTALMKRSLEVISLANRQSFEALKYLLSLQKISLDSTGEAILPLAPMAFVGMGVGEMLRGFDPKRIEAKRAVHSSQDFDALMSKIMAKK